MCLSTPVTIVSLKVRFPRPLPISCSAITWYALFKDWSQLSECTSGHAKPTLFHSALAWRIAYYSNHCSVTVPLNISDYKFRCLLRVHLILTHTGLTIPFCLSSFIHCLALSFLDLFYLSSCKFVFVARCDTQVCNSILW